MKGVHFRLQKKSILFLCLIHMLFDNRREDKPVCTMHSVYLLKGAKEQRLALTELHGSSIVSMLIIRLLIMEVAV